MKGISWTFCFCAYLYPVLYIHHRIAAGLLSRGIFLLVLPGANERWGKARNGRASFSAVVYKNAETTFHRVLNTPARRVKSRVYCGQRSSRATTRGVPGPFFSLPRIFLPRLIYRLMGSFIFKRSWRRQRHNDDADAARSHPWRRLEERRTHLILGPRWRYKLPRHLLITKSLIRGTKFLRTVRERDGPPDLAMSYLWSFETPVYRRNVLQTRFSELIFRVSILFHLLSYTSFWETKRWFDVSTKCKNYRTDGISLYGGNFIIS